MLIQKDFKQIFATARAEVDKENILERLVDVSWFGLIYVFRGISLRLSLVASIILIGFVMLDVTWKMVRLMPKYPPEMLIKQILPNIVKGFLTFLVLIVPLNYKSTVGLGTTNVSQTGTIYTMLVETIYNTFYNLGVKFFNNTAMETMTPGKIAGVFLNQPFNIIKSMFSINQFLSIPANFLKIIVMLFCLWLATKIIGNLLANLWSSLMICTFSMFYLMFLPMDSTNSIGQKGVTNIISQAFVIFMTMAVMGIIYQIMEQISASDSLQGVITLTIIMMLFQQIMESVGIMAAAITNGGGLGQSNSSTFMNFAGSLTTLAGGVAMATGNAIGSAIDNYQDGVEQNKANGDGSKSNFSAGMESLAKNSTLGNMIGLGPSSLSKAQKEKAAQIEANKLAELKRNGMNEKDAKRVAKQLGNEYKQALKDANINQAKQRDENRKLNRNSGVLSMIGTAGSLYANAMSGNMNFQKIGSAIGNGQRDRERAEGNLKTLKSNQEQLLARIAVLEATNGITTGLQGSAVGDGSTTPITPEGINGSFDTSLGNADITPNATGGYDVSINGGNIVSVNDPNSQNNATTVNSNGDGTYSVTLNGSQNAITVNGNEVASDLENAHKTALENGPYKTETQKTIDRAVEEFNGNLFTSMNLTNSINDGPAFKLDKEKDDKTEKLIAGSSNNGSGSSSPQQQTRNDVAHQIPQSATSTFTPINSSGGNS